jgi:hypothetical protein
LQRLEAPGRRDHHVGQIAERHHGPQIARRVVGQRHMRVGRDRDPRRGDQDGVAIRLRFGDRRDADDVRRPRPVLGDDGLPDLARHLLEHDARRDIERAARGVGDDDMDRLLGRPFLRQGRAVRRNKHEQSQQQVLAHLVSPLMSASVSQPLRFAASLFKACSRTIPMKTFDAGDVSWVR